jgi:DNA-binding winged helix-turn-helix (wHTH) protein
MQGRSKMKFAGFELNTKRGELFYAGQRVPLQEQPLKLLELLLQSPGEIVGRARIREQLWGRAHIDHEHGINTAVRKLRKALAAHNAGQVSIATSSGRGYRLLLPKTNTLPSQLDPAGYEAYLTGRFLFSQRNPASLFAAKAKFELACERMPEFSLAHASLSRTCRFLTIFEVCEPGPLWEQAELHATRAVQLDASASEAQSSLACVLARYRWRWAEGCAVYQEALRLNPDDAETCCDYGVATKALAAWTVCLGSTRATPWAAPPPRWDG